MRGVKSKMLRRAALAIVPNELAPFRKWESLLIKWGVACEKFCPWFIKWRMECYRAKNMRHIGRQMQKRERVYRILKAKYKGK